MYHYRWHAAQTSTAKRHEQIGFSDTVRKTVLTRFCITDPVLIDVHLHFCHKEPYKIANPGKNIVSYYEALVAANAQKEIFPDQAFRRYLASKICTDMRRCGLNGLKFYLSFPYKLDVNWSAAETIRFFIKSLRPTPKA
ncbi:MAG: hypothetical protein HQ501_07475 [Rhodospirillales bacterium]|nr:hypothetical protein [Rhodospirillales bacterium]